MLYEKQTAIRRILSDIKLPRFIPVRQIFPDDSLENICAHLQKKLNDAKISSSIKPGMKVVMTGSSREIANMPEILRELSRFIKNCRADPYIIPAMGSHGGATAEGQKRLLESYGITEKFCECPIISSMETVSVGYVGNDPVRMDKFSNDADAIILVGRIKGHTAFSGTYESGMAKMISIGLGKREGADILHKYGFGKMSERIPLFANVILDHANIIFGVAAIENERNRTCRIEVLRSDEILKREPALLDYAKSRMPRLLLPETDILVIREIGKNISGSGMDPNITGTFATPFKTGGLKKQRVVVLDITDESHGNYLGLGNADVSCLRAFNKIRTNGCYTNMLTSTVTDVGKIPMIMEDDELALRTAIKLMTSGDRQNPRMIYIKNTLCLEKILVSEAHMAEIKANPNLEILGEPAFLNFDKDGNLNKF